MDEPAPPPADAAEDERLVRRSAAGDQRAFHTLVDRHADRLFRLAVSLVGNRADAEDVVQEALAGAYRGAAKFRGTAAGGGSVKAWLSQILATQAAKAWRDRKGERPAPLNESAAGPGTAAGVEAKLDLQTALARLSPEHRQVLVLREIDGLAYDEIAAALGLARGTVESRLFRARAELRTALTGYNF